MCVRDPPRPRSMVLLLLILPAVLLWALWSVFSERKRRPYRAFPALQCEKENFFSAASAVAKECKEIDTTCYEGSVRALKLFMKRVPLNVEKDLVRFKGSHNLFNFHRHGASRFDFGLGIRITVQYNLFGGSVANLGSKKQREWLAGVFERQEIGCFALTEVRAGVLSGLIVETTATFKDGSFLIHSGPGAEKHWISNGLHAKWAVVVARLILADNTDKGPHAFIVDMESKGVERSDMPPKVAFNGLDNALIKFDNVTIPAENLLSGISFVDAKGEYHLVDAKKPFSFVHVAQRLLSGRICIAGAALNVVREVVEQVHSYSQNRRIPTGKDEDMSLAELPVMRDTLADVQRRWDELSKYLEILENRFLGEEDLSENLVHCVNCAKIECIRFAIDSFFELKMRVGAFAVQESSPFGTLAGFEPCLYCQRFAEGDCAVLEQKMARDAVKAYSRTPWKILLDFAKIPLLFREKNAVLKARFEFSKIL